MKTSTLRAIPISPETAARFAALIEEHKRVIRMRVAIETGRLSRPKSRAESAAEFPTALAAIGNQARKDVCRIFQHLQSLPHVEIENRASVERARGDQ